MFLKNIKLPLLIVALVIAIAAIMPVVSADVYINCPAVITTPGTYVINSDYNGPGPAVWVDGIFPPTDDVVIDGYGHTLTGTGTGLGIYVWPGCDRVHVKNVTVQNYDYGIVYQGVSNGLIENCDVRNNDIAGIVLFGSNNIDVRNNRVENNDMGTPNGVGIYSLNCFDNEITDNRVEYNGVGIVSFATVLETITENQVNSNTFDGILHIGMDAVIDRNIVSSNGDAGIVALWSDDASISYNSINLNPGMGFFDSGIYILDSPPILADNTGLLIDENTVNQNKNGIRLFGLFGGSHDNIVTRNTVSSNTVNGIELSGALTRFNTIGDNTITNNGAGGAPGTGNGVLLREAPSNTIEDNYVEGNDGFGIKLEGILAPGLPITGVRVDANLIKDNNDGIYLFRAWNNVVINNVIIQNAKEGMWLSRSSLNTIHNNCFNNPVNVAFDPIIILPNNWNTLIAPGPNIVGGKYFGGNYWANPSGTGHSQVTPPNADEFSNAALFIAAGNTDNFALWNPLVASFTTNPSPADGEVPFTVDFTDTSLGNPTCWLWDFGDGTPNSTDQNPSHTYTSDGTYTVTFTASRCPVAECAGTSTVTTTVHVGPQADFTATPLVGPAPLTVTFTDTSTVTGTTYSWDFGDGGNSTVRNTVHEYMNPGLYNVSLTVNGTFGTDTEEKVNYIDVRTPLGPVANFTASPQSGTIPLTVNFIDMSSGDCTGWEWDFGDGTPNSTDRNPTHTYCANDDYTVTLTVTNAGGSHSETKTAYIRVSDIPVPVANFTASPHEGIEDLVVHFKDTSFNSPTSWHWDFGDGGTSNLQSPNHTYTTPGRYNVTLMVSNAQGQNSLTRNNCIYVKNTPPVAGFSASPLSGDAPLTVQFNDESGGLAITSWQWNFGDGGTSTTKSPLYVYNTQGTYTVNLAVANDGGSDPEVKTNYITVNPAQPANIIKLYPGWNFVSVPKRLADGHNTASQVFGGVDLGPNGVLLWDADAVAWKKVMAGNILQPLNGYWIDSVTRIDVPLTFDTVTTPAPYPKQLYTGWNAIGYAGTTSMSARNFLTLGGGLNGNWDILYGYHDGILPDIPIIRDSNDGLPMYPTKGYWIAMNQNDTLTAVV